MKSDSELTLSLEIRALATESKSVLSEGKRLGWHLHSTETGFFEVKKCSYQWIKN